jgi:[Skp1-protein]-hydroxyproline N-acetylglucosaminyltransferase
MSTSTPLLGSRSESNGSPSALDRDARRERYKYIRKRSASRQTNFDTAPPPITSSKAFLLLLVLLAIALSIQFVIVFSWHHGRHDAHVLGKSSSGREALKEAFQKAAAVVKKALPPKLDSSGGDVPSHLFPQVPPLPPILNTRQIPDREKLIDNTLTGENPTVAGITLILAGFLEAMHQSNNELARREKPHKVQRDDVHSAFVKLAQTHLKPLEERYRDKPIFPVRDDDSIFISLASFRDYLLGDTLKGAFDQAKYPDKLFIGAVVQNCYGLNPFPGEDGVQCRTGAQVVGKKPNGADKTQVSDAPPDRNGIEEFCNSPRHSKYCENGQVRALYLHENESLGPAMARYYASKLWGGETYFMQVDSHLQFYSGWDELYTNELKSTKSFPKAVLSSYPPGFTQENGGILNKESSGARLCTCEFSQSDVESDIIRINTGVGYHGDEEHPTQIPFIAAGFFFTEASFLVDVPFDPYMPWCFMGEEIMLSMRAWTHGWDIYAPRKNWIAHQYRPGRMGLPKVSNAHIRS